jgi:hypothetical protein
LHDACVGNPANEYLRLATDLVGKLTCERLANLYPSLFQDDEHIAQASIIHTSSVRRKIGLALLNFREQKKQAQYNIAYCIFPCFIAVWHHR